MSRKCNNAKEVRNGLEAYATPAKKKIKPKNRERRQVQSYRIQNGQAHLAFQIQNSAKLHSIENEYVMKRPGQPLKEMALPTLTPSLTITSDFSSSEGEEKGQDDDEERYNEGETSDDGSGANGGDENGTTMHSAAIGGSMGKHTHAEE